MPAHGAVHTIGNVLKSYGCPITAIDWRANRLVDALAKAAARETRVHPAAMKLASTAARLMEYSAARAGAVTFAANNYKVQRLNVDGTTSWEV